MHCRGDLLSQLIREFIRRILPKPKAQVTLRLGTFSVTFVGDYSMQLPDDKVVTASVSYKDAKGFAAQVQGAPVWASDNADVASVVASDDGFSATITPGNSLGMAQISVTADADLGDGVENVVALGSIEVIAGKAVAGDVSFGEPTNP